ncbi:hypothetical protein H4684_002334 [Desulfomicrobium macestii]|uniref:Uncharacterized protein n=2 Tax=Desulfomicrobium macestii TaxID=90731 RepID=A0ABR9H4N5_9BACT|nr:hypothetical protein [Desulfomicrobium macestii]
MPRTMEATKSPETNLVCIFDGLRRCMGSPEIDASRGGGNVCEVDEDAFAQTVGKTKSKKGTIEIISVLTSSNQDLKPFGCS